MPGFDTVLSFFAISVLLALSPGPDNLFVLALSAAQGRAAGMRVVIGLCIGLVGHTLAVAAGLAAMFAASPAAFTALKLAGAGYLLWLAWLSLRPRQADGPAPASRASPATPPPRRRQRLVRRGIIMNLTNPKVSLFFLALLPQFTSPQHGPVVTQILWLGVIFMLATLLVFGLIAWFAGLLGERLQRSPRIHRLMQRLAGLVFIGLALKLAFSPSLGAETV
ncbi:MAG: LysE family translocator [Castellaniella sp.]